MSDGLTTRVPGRGQSADSGSGAGKGGSGAASVVSSEAPPGSCGWRRYGLQVPAVTSRVQLLGQVIDTVVPLIVSGCQM